MLECLNNVSFRPRVGMGWFKKPKDYARRHMRFSSPSGDGVVLIKKGENIMTIKFSSPSGDGLVLKNEKNKCKNLKIFVPAWGWVGSIFSPCKNQLVYVFSSPSGDGLVLGRH